MRVTRKEGIQLFKRRQNDGAQRVRGVKRHLVLGRDGEIFWQRHSAVQQLMHTWNQHPLQPLKRLQGIHAERLVAGKGAFVRRIILPVLIGKLIAGFAAIGLAYWLSVPKALELEQQDRAAGIIEQDEYPVAGKPQVR